MGVEMTEKQSIDATGHAQQFVSLVDRDWLNVSLKLHLRFVGAVYVEAVFYHVL